LSEEFLEKLKESQSSEDKTEKSSTGLWDVPEAAAEIEPCGKFVAHGQYRTRAAIG